MANTRIRQITIDGYLATEPKAFENTDKYGIQIVYFTIPTQTYGENNTMWFDVYTPYNLVGPILPYLKKGRYVLVSGDFFEREYTGADGLIRTRKTIRNATVRFGNSGNYESNNNSNNGYAKTNEGYAAQGNAVNNNAPYGTAPDPSIQVKRPAYVKASEADRVANIPQQQPRMQQMPPEQPQPVMSPSANTEIEDLPF